MLGLSHPSHHGDHPIHNVSLEADFVPRLQVVKTALWIIVLGIETANFSHQTANDWYRMDLGTYVGMGVEVFVIIVL